MKTIPLLALLFASAPALAGGPNSALERYFADALERVDSAAERAPASPAAPAFTLQDINVDVNGTVAFGISDVLQLSVSPEVDFVLVPDPAP